MEALFDVSGDIEVFVNISTGTAADWVTNNQNATLTLIIDGTTVSALVSECSTSTSGSRLEATIPNSDASLLVQDNAITFAITEA